MFLFFELLLRLDEDIRVHVELSFLFYYPSEVAIALVCFFSLFVIKHQHQRWVFLTRLVIF